MTAPPPVTVLRGHAVPVNCVCFHSYRSILSGDTSGLLFLWDTESRRTARRLQAHAGSILSISNFPCADRNIVTSGRDGMVKLWDLTSMESPIASVQSGAMHFCNTATVRSSEATSSDAADIFASPSAVESDILLWDKRSMGSVGKFQLSSSLGMTSSVCMVDQASLHAENSSHDAPLAHGGALVVFVGGEDGSLAGFDTRNAIHPIFVEKRHAQPLMAIDVAIRRQDDATADFLLATGGADERLMLSRLTTEDSGMDRKPQAGEIRELSVAGTSSVCYRSDGRLLASSHWDGTTRLWQVKLSHKKEPRGYSSLRPLATLTHHRESVLGVDFCRQSEGLQYSRQSGLFATASKDGTVAVWDVYVDNIK